MARRMWTKEEIDYLMDSCSYKSIKLIANNLGRTERAVSSKMSMLGIRNTKDNYSGFTINQLAECSGHSRKTVRGWINKGLKRTIRTVGYESKVSFIKPKNFWNFAKDNPQYVNLKKIEMGTILPEPEWFKEERKLKDMINKGCSLEEMSKKLKRSKASINRKRFRIMNSKGDNISG